tara:strand:+ start:2233 stop:2445 length:213 start_codon:yes stop_codon:yes gene_type:complete
MPVDAQEMAKRFYESMKAAQQKDLADLIDDQQELSEKENQPTVDLSSKILEQAKRLHDTEIIINQIEKLK